MLSAPRSAHQLRLTYPDAIKFLAIVAVIIAHLPPSRFDSEALASIQLVQQLTGWCVLAFFAVAGVLFAQTAQRPLLVEIARRAKRLLIPWLAFTILYKLVITLLEVIGVVQRVPLPPADFGGVVRWLCVPADPQLYFLLYLFVIQAVCLIIAKLDARSVLFAGVCALALWLASLCSSGWSGAVLHGSSRFLVPLYFAYFACGTWGGRSGGRLGAITGLFAVAAAFVLLNSGAIAIAWQLVAPWLLLLLLHRFESTAFVGGMAKVGRFSGGVYVWHAPLVIGFVSIAACLLLGGSVWAALAVVVVSFSVSVVIGTIVNRIPRLQWFHL